MIYATSNWAKYKIKLKLLVHFSFAAKAFYAACRLALSHTADWLPRI